MNPDQHDPTDLEGDLHTIGDDEFFDALATMPAVRDADGQLVDVAGDVQDRRAEKAAAASEEQGR